MGYTHYWENTAPVPADVWAKVIADVSKLIAAFDSKVRYESDSRKKPVCDAEMIRFNGVGEQGHETFLIAPNHLGFDFCKTACKPYDTLVVAVLAVASGHWPAFSVSSDGNSDSWKPGLQYAERVLGRTVPLPTKIYI